MDNELTALTARILEKITPKKKDYKKVEVLTRDLESKITVVCQQEGIPAIVRAEGSVAKDTWLRDSLDVDIFMRLPKTIPRKNLGEVGLKIAKKAAGTAKQIERFAEHPYLEIFLERHRIDIVPCYEAAPGEWQSATDRTPYHTDYIKTHLNKNLRGEVRLLKKFMQGIGVYGAEIKVGGFSGYLCELLILKYGSFAKVIQTFADYSKRIVIDLEDFHTKRAKELFLLFPEPLVIVDPVDEARNVASAVQNQKLYTFIGASREFLNTPSEYFFYPPKPKVYTLQELNSQLQSRCSTLLFLLVYPSDVVPDVLWGQLHRTKRSLRKLLELNDYGVLRDSVWSSEKSLSVFIFELERQYLSDIRKHIGPPLERRAESQKFLAKYMGKKKVKSGPYIEDGRWTVELPRKNTDAIVLLKEKLVDGGKNVGVAGLIAKTQKSFKILVNTEILEVYDGNSGFAEALTEFLVGKPFWIISQ